MKPSLDVKPLFETPCLVIREEQLHANVAAMAEAVVRTSAKLRPHTKTHKLPEMAQLQIDEGADGITVAKIAEAEVMAAGGIRDIFVAYPIVAYSKLERAARLLQAGIRLILGVDSKDGASRMSEIAVREGISFEARLEIDSGMARTGVTPSDAVKLAEWIHSLPGIHLTGLFTYRGAMLKGAATMELRAAGHEEGRIMAQTAAAIRDAGIPIAEVSVGSSPTALYAAEIEGITEVRPGTYIYQDRMQAAFGLCHLEDCAGTIWATVVSRPAPDRIVIDGGSKTFATDVQPGKPPLHLKGFGHIVGDDAAVFDRMSEEHGVILVDPDSDYRIGDIISIIPNHICSTVNLHNSIYLENADGELKKIKIAARGLLD
ncbi:alanine racemase [Paenibacillus sp. HB172176]|uniref:alanine racemase n=1 Tax=Paenibacillus sp. HB172176 TaxID=2493690 RepID=UPI00143A2E81|nr:alanine racemase [Paenibacillus sp. HB172176]